MSITQNLAWKNALENHLLLGGLAPISTLQWMFVSDAESQDQKYENLKDWINDQLPKATLLRSPQEVSHQLPAALYPSIKARAIFLIQARQRDLEMWGLLEKAPHCKEDFITTILELGMRKDLDLASIPIDTILKEEISLLKKWEKDPSLLLSHRSAIKTVIKVKGFLASFQSRQ